MASTAMTHFSSLLLLLLLVVGLAALSLARELYVSNRWASGEVMASVMAEKHRTWDDYTVRGYFAEGRWRSSNRFAPCVAASGSAAGKATVAGIEYGCKNLDVTGKMRSNAMYPQLWGVGVDVGTTGYLSHQDLGSTFTNTIGTSLPSALPSSPPAHEILARDQAAPSGA